MKEYHWCRWCKKETNWFMKIKRCRDNKKRKTMICSECNLTRGYEGFMKSKKQYDEKLFTPSTEKLMKEKFSK